MTVASTPAELGDIARSAVVVIDVLRATTSMVVALANGCREVRPVATVEEALALAGPGTVLAGERGGLPLSGFALGNSPLEFTAEVVAGRRLVMTTTNGTQALLAAGAARLVTIGCFLNAGAVAAALAGEGEVVCLCAGRAGRFSLEDWVAAGMLVEEMVRLEPEMEMDDAARAARAAYNQYSADLLRLLCLSEHGRRLAALGYSADLGLASRRNTHPVVPRLAAGSLRVRM